MEVQLDIDCPQGSPEGVIGGNEITRCNRGHKVEVVIGELKFYARGWLNNHKVSSTYKEVLELAGWVWRRVRLYYWKPA